jgi:ATP-dependent RNA helicase DeaD
LQSFDELQLSKEIMKSIQEMGFQTPSPIQAQSLPILLGEDTDFIGQAATGTGKTAAFGIPLIEKIDAKLKAVQGLILCPTRELAMQVSAQIDLLGKYWGIRSIAIYGGAAYDQQIAGIRQGRTIVVGTPGRILDHLERGTLKLGSVKTVVLDEADEMISMGFKEAIEAILEQVPNESANTWLFSATMSPDVRQVANNYLDNPQHVVVNRQEVLSANVEQVFYHTRESDKPDILCKVIDAAENFYGIIFCQTKLLVVDLVKHMQQRGYKVDCLHGDMNQSARERAMASFRDRDVQVLVCTDVASRGLDVNDVTHVVNYSLPREIDVYVHRIGRTARRGQAGVAVALVTPSHRALIRRIEQVTKSRMIEGKIPGRREIALKKVSEKLAAFKDAEWFTRAIESMSEEWKAAIAGMSVEEVAGRFLAMQMADLFSDREQHGEKRLGRRDEPSMDDQIRRAGDRPRRFDRDRRDDRRDDRPRRFDRDRRDDRPRNDDRPPRRFDRDRRDEGGDDRREGGKPKFARSTYGGRGPSKPGGKRFDREKPSYH